MTLVDVNIKVPVEMEVYLKPSSQVVELDAAFIRSQKSFIMKVR